MDLYFSQYFDVDPAVLETYGAFDISVYTDLPLMPAAQGRFRP